MNKRYSVLWVIGWNGAHNEAEGGRSVGEFATLAEAWKMRQEIEHGKALAHRLWGSGKCVVTGPDHQLILGSAALLLARAEQVSEPKKLLSWREVGDLVYEPTCKQPTDTDWDDS